MCWNVNVLEMHSLVSGQTNLGAERAERSTGVIFLETGKMNLLAECSSDYMRYLDMFAFRVAPVKGHPEYKRWGDLWIQWKVRLGCSCCPDGHSESRGHLEGNTLCGFVCWRITHMFLVSLQRYTSERGSTRTQNVMTISLAFVIDSNLRELF